MISRIEPYKYRCFNTLDLALEQQHVFAGSNGSGKTTLLDIPTLSGNLLNIENINDTFFKPMNAKEKENGTLYLCKQAERWFAAVQQ